MKHLLFIILFSFSFSAFSQAKFTLQPNAEIGELSFDEQALCEVATATKTYLAKGRAYDEKANHPGTVIPGLSLEQVKQTLNFLCQVVTEDKQQGNASRLKQADFLKQHFNVYHWQPDLKQAEKYAEETNHQGKARILNAIPDDQLLLTKYYTKLLKASPVKTSTYNHALYRLPYDEQGLTIEQAQEKRSKLSRFKYTRQQVMKGVLDENKLAEPMVWLTEAALHDVLLQGTGVLDLGDRTEYYNVHRNNGISYDYALGKDQQARYWYFAKVPSIMGYGKEITSKIALREQVSLAGNVKALGLGKLIMLSYQQKGDDKLRSRLAILADEGGAFDNNLFQLDLLVGSYYGWKDYHQANKNTPDFAKAQILLKK
ncbi:MltA domain-containing protein [Catenovulum sp. SM1970]|uniref:MltA domain-containing protein n=1 Tax=Marinifaba aquimaris TaxID=2741323 RepID=UPI001571B5FE|nr:MltA domain-containing protein [Marinifaba aquimaris]NTS75599.1 MltA domain-containing protein [Marinifaba aquimaris]